jgi:hypothetical protein
MRRKLSLYGSGPENLRRLRVPTPRNNDERIVARYEEIAAVAERIDEEYE